MKYPALVFDTTKVLSDWMEHTRQIGLTFDAEVPREGSIWRDVHAGILRHFSAGTLAWGRVPKAAPRGEVVDESDANSDDPPRPQARVRFDSVPWDVYSLPNRAPSAKKGPPALFSFHPSTLAPDVFNYDKVEHMNKRMYRPYEAGDDYYGLKCLVIGTSSTLLSVQV